MEGFIRRCVALNSWEVLFSPPFVAKATALACITTKFTLLLAWSAELTITGEMPHVHTNWRGDISGSMCFIFS